MGRFIALLVAAVLGAGCQDVPVLPTPTPTPTPVPGPVTITGPIKPGAYEVRYHTLSKYLLAKVPLTVR